MRIEYTKQQGEFAYVFTKSERSVIAGRLKGHIRKLKNRIEKLKNHPKNEGQATYASKIDELYGEILNYEEIIDGLK